MSILMGTDRQGGNKSIMQLNKEQLGEEKGLPED